MKQKFLRKTIDRFSFLFKGKISFKGGKKREKFDTISQLLDDHFSLNTVYDHPCKNTLQMALEKLNNKEATIVETGSSAWGSNSSLLFDSYVNSFGGKFCSVDIRIEPCITLKSLCSSNSTFFCDDSVSFLKKMLTKNPSLKIDLVYLDSYDVNWDDSLAAALYGFQEFMVLLPSLIENKGSLLLVDDTPADSLIMEKVQPNGLLGFNEFKRNYGFEPGKGALIKYYLLNNSIGKQIKHDYQLLWEF